MSSIKVLLIEADPVNAGIIREMMHEKGRKKSFDLTWAASAEAGLSELSGREFDVVLFGLSLRDVCGLEAFACVRTRSEGTPIILLGEVDDEQQALEAIRRGAQDYAVRGRIDGDLLERSIRLAIEREKSVKTLREEDRAGSETAVTHAAEGIVVTDTLGNIRYVNPAYESLTGYTHAEAEGKHPDAFCSANPDETVYGRILAVAEHGEAWRGRITQRRKDGGTFEADAAVFPVPAGGRIVGCVVLMRDTGREAGLQKLLRRAQKMEAIGTLAAGISHDFNNILGIVMGYAEMAMLRTEDVVTRKHLDQVLKASFRARDLVRQILYFSRQEERVKRSVDILPIVKEALKLLRSSLPATIQIRQNIQEPPYIVLADPIQIHQVLTNLCTMASKAMHENGGTLTVGLTRVELDPEVADRSGLKSGSYVRLSVGDTGQGMEPSVAERIFEPGVASEKADEDAETGLAVVHEIVRDHGGDIRVRSELGKGTVFEVSLPYRERPKAQDLPPAAGLPRGNERILYIDDEGPLVAIGREMLEYLGYTVAGSTSGPEAVDLFRRQPGRFDLVITDLTMPFITGIQLTARIKKIRPDIPVILCTGFNDFMPPETAEAAGIREVLRKPLNLGEIAAAVRRALEKRASG